MKYLFSQVYGGWVHAFELRDFCYFDTFKTLRRGNPTIGRVVEGAQATALYIFFPYNMFASAQDMVKV